MQRVRTGRIAKVLAILFLVWTGMDLVYPDFCALDRQPPPPHTVAVVGGTFSPDSPVSPKNTDDCFCCSHNVLAATALFIVPDAGPIQAMRVAPADHVRALQARLYHPPQLV